MALLRALVCLGLPPVLLAVSFALAIASSVSAQWAVSSLYSPYGTVELWPNRTHHRGVFVYCTISMPASNSSTILTPPVEHCMRFPPRRNGGSCSLLADRKTGIIQAAVLNNQHLCQQVNLAGRLLIAGAVLVGVAMILALAVAALSWRTYTSRTAETAPPPSSSAAAATNTATSTVYPTKDDDDEENAAATASATPTSAARHRGLRTQGNASAGATSNSKLDDAPASSSSPFRIGRVRTSTLTPYVAHLTFLLLLGATALLIVTHVLGVNSLVNDQVPNGDYMSSGGLFGASAPTSNGPWYMGRVTLAYMPTAWICSGLGLWIAAWGWDTGTALRW